MAGKPVILVALAMTLSVTGALAADPPAPAEKEPLICRGATRTLGSRVRSQRRCRTAEQWQREDEEKGGLPISLQVTQGQNDGNQGRTPQ